VNQVLKLSLAGGDDPASPSVLQLPGSDPAAPDPTMDGTDGDLEPASNFCDGPHSEATTTTPEQSGQKGATSPGNSTLLGERTILGQLSHIPFVFVPRDVPGIAILQQDRPSLARESLRNVLHPSRFGILARAPVG